MLGDDPSLPVRRRGLFEALSRKEEIEEEIIFLLTHHRYTPVDIRLAEAEITPATSLAYLDMNDEDIYIVFTAVLENEFQIKLDHIEVGSFKTVADIANAIYPLLPEIEKQKCANAAPTPPEPFVPTTVLSIIFEKFRLSLEKMGEGPYIAITGQRNANDTETPEEAEQETATKQTIGHLRALKLP